MLAEGRKSLPVISLFVILRVARKENQAGFEAEKLLISRERLDSFSIYYLYKAISLPIL